jgi:hypothetical protein
VGKTVFWGYCKCFFILRTTQSKARPRGNAGHLQIASFRLGRVFLVSEWENCFLGFFYTTNNSGLGSSSLVAHVLHSPPPTREQLCNRSLTHARRMDGFCNQNSDQLGSLAGLSFPVVYVGVVECAPASPYTYSSSTHRFPDERTPIEATLLSATSAELVLGVGLGMGLGSHSSSHAPLLLATLLSHTIPLPRVH